MAVIGAHMLIHTPEAEAVRALFADAFGWRHVDMGEGWLIFAMPPAEIAVHPSGRSHHEISLMCDDLDETVRNLQDKGVTFGDEINDEGWGVTIAMHLPGGVDVTLYEPRHPTALP